MPKMPFDNDDVVRVTIPEPDVHGQAALMLAESILHTLIEIGVLTVPEAVEVVSTAMEVRRELAKSAGGSDVTIEKSLTLLSAISASFRSDLPPVRAA